MNNRKTPSTFSKLKSWLGFGPINPTVDGGLATSWPSNWWQKNYTPLMYGENATVNGCVDAYAQTLATLPVRHIRRKSNGGKEIITTSAASRVLRKPNGYQTRTDFMLNLVRNLYFSGNAYGFATRNNRFEVDHIHLLPVRGTRPYIDPETKSIFYGVGENPLVGDIDSLIPQRDIFHLRLHCPRHPLEGVTVLENCVLALQSNNALLGHQAAFFTNMSRPSGILSTDTTLTKDQFRQLQSAWRDKSQGLNSGEVPMLHSGFKFQSLSLNSQDAQIIQAYAMTVEDIARAFRIPLPLIGDLRQVGFNNVEQLVNYWLATGLGFLIEHVELAFASFFELPPGESIECDTKALLRTDFAARIDALTKGIQGGLYAPNEARAEEGLPEAEYGDEPRLQAQVVPLSQVAVQSAAGAPAANVTTEEIVSSNDDELDIDEDETRALLAYGIQKRLANDGR